MQGYSEEKINISAALRTVRKVSFFKFQMLLDMYTFYAYTKILEIPAATFSEYRRFYVI